MQTLDLQHDKLNADKARQKLHLKFIIKNPGYSK